MKKRKPYTILPLTKEELSKEAEKQRLSDLERRGKEPLYTPVEGGSQKSIIRYD
jgi:hypothetical protein